MSLSARQKNHPWIFDIVVLSSLLALLYFIGLGSYPLFNPDEARYSEVAREMIATADLITPRVNGVVFFDKPILFYWLQVLAFKMFGVSEWAARFMPVMAAILTCIATYATARVLYSRTTGIFAFIILATSLLFFASSHYANLDLEVACWITLSLFCFINGFIQLNYRYIFYILVYATSALAFLTKGLIGIVFPCAIISIWLLSTKSLRHLRQVISVSGIVISLAIILPWFILIEKQHQFFLQYYFWQQQVVRFVSADVFNNRLPWWVYLPIVLLGFFPWSCFMLQTMWRSIKSKNSYDLFFVIWIIFVIVFFSIPHSKIVTYILPVFPPLSILVGRYISIYSEWSSKERYFACICFATLNLVLSIACLALVYNNQWINTLLPYLIIAQLIFFLAILASLFLTRHKTTVVLIPTSTSILFVLLLVKIAPFLNTNSTQPFIRNLSHISSNDNVTAYYKYYYDLPFYLKRKINLVYDWNAQTITRKDNWARELLTGRQWYQPANLQTEEEFWQRWNSKQTIYVFLNENYLEQFKRHTHNINPLARFNDVILLTNVSALKHP